MKFKMCFLSDSCFFFLIVGAVAVHASPAGCPVEGRSVRTPPRGGNVSPINQFLETEVRAPGVNISVSSILLFHILFCSICSEYFSLFKPVKKLMRSHEILRKFLTLFTDKLF